MHSVERHIKQTLGNHRENEKLANIEMEMFIPPVCFEFF